MSKLSEYVAFNTQKDSARAKCVVQVTPFTVGPTNLGKAWIKFHERGLAFVNGEAINGLTLSELQALYKAVGIFLWNVAEATIE